MIEDDIDGWLQARQDTKYREMQVKILPSLSSDAIIGVRTPDLRKYAKELGKREDVNEFLAALPHRFFEENNGKEFIHYTSNEVEQLSVNRIQYYHFFRRRRNTFTKYLAQIALRIQKLLHVNRLKGTNIQVQKGCNWFSITGELAHYIVSHMKEYEKVFRYSYCGDETFIQTIVESTPFKKNVFMPNCNNNHDACMRLIDWERGNPYIWRTEDYELIKNSPCVFARKFDMNTDAQIVDKILENR